MRDRKRVAFKKFLKFLLKIFNIKTKPHVIFDPCRAFHFFHVLPIIEKLIQDDLINITLIRDDDFDESKFDLPNVKFLTYRELWHNWFGLYDMYIATDFERKPGWSELLTTVCMFHGAGPKMSYLKDSRIKDFDMLLVVGPSTYEVINEVATDNMVIVPNGLPIIDKLCSSTSSQLPLSVRFTDNKPILLYAPSWSSDVNNISMDEEILDSLKELKNYNIIIRPHPLLLQPKFCGGINWEEKLQSIKSDNVKISYPLEHSAYDLLPFADILMSDISSVLYEFLVLDRPVITYMKDDILESYDADDFIEPLNAATTKLESPQELNHILDNIETIAADKKAARKKLMDLTFYNVGTATSNAVECIYKNT